MKPHDFLRSLTPPFLWRFASSYAARHADGIEVDNNQIELRAGLDLRIHPDSRKPFEYFRTIDKVMVEELDRFLELSDGKNALLDVGALHGIFSLGFTANHPERRALAVEASPIAFARLLYNIHANPTCHVEVAEVALSDRKGNLLMGYEWEHAVASPVQKGRQLSVSALSGDDLCRKKNFAPDMIKIDVEGHEMHVLRGLKDTLTAHRPLIFLEVHPSRLNSQGEKPEQVFEFLKFHGYSIHPCSPDRDGGISSSFRGPADLRLIFFHESL